MKPIPDFIGYYVTNKGRVWSSKSNLWLTPGVDTDGYYQVLLYYDNGKRMTKKIHRLVAETFLSNPNNLPIVNHKNENRQDNFVDNLEWCSVLYNNNYGNRNTKLSNRLEVQRGRAIYKCDMDWNIIEQFPSITKAAQSVLGDVSSISKAARGKRTTYTLYGYNWIIASDYDNIKGGGADV